jgi:CRISPR/Cas system-associated exonuclease Cas4 (RecB family)
MMDHCELPDPKPVQYVTPSSAYSISQCKLKVAYRSDQGYRGKTPSSQASRLGTACHEVLEAAGRGELPRSTGPEWRTAFDAKWGAAIRKQEEEASGNRFERHWPPAAKWRNYSIRKIATRRLAEELSAAGDGAAPVLEERQEAFGGRLRGRADVIRRGAETTEIQDYKTGSLFESGSDELKESYRMQMLLYAALEEAETGRCPVRATLVPLEGERVSLEITSEDVAAAAEEALAGLDAYDQAIESGTPAQELGSPGLDACRFCTYAVRCPRFWQSATPEWAGEGVLAVAGHVLRLEHAEHGSVGILLDVTSGSGGEGEAWIYGVDPERFYLAATAEPGSAIGATGLAGDPDSRAFRTTDRSRIVTGTP